MTLIVVTFTYDPEKNEFQYYSNTDPVAALQVLQQLAINMAVQASRSEGQLTDQKEEADAPDGVPTEPEN